MRAVLGRPYPDDIQEWIRLASKHLDELLAKSQELFFRYEIDIVPELSDLSTRISNDVIIASDQITDEEAKERLGDIFQEIYRLQALVDESLVATDPVPGTAPISVSKANEIANNFSQANLELYPAILERYSKIKEAVETATVLPGVGLQLSVMIRDFETILDSLGNTQVDAYRAYNDLVAQTRTQDQTVNVSENDISLLNNWIGMAYSAEEALKRLEAIAMKKPASSRDAMTGKTPWGMIAIGGLVLLGLAGWAILE